ncbi:Uncharacterised protein [Mycobacteroides abscessus subsp. abscessus]|nr:Uncharacterised protein [Mycobacteroides abscessus subsp. abscessus]
MGVRRVVHPAQLGQRLVHEHRRPPQQFAIALLSTARGTRQFVADSSQCHIGAHRDSGERGPRL